VPRDADPAASDRADAQGESRAEHAGVSASSRANAPVEHGAPPAGGARAVAVEARDLTRRFGRFIAVDHVSFEVERGEIFGFLGANGAGKTTTIRMLTGLLLPTGGTGVVNGYDVGRNPQAVRRSIGYMSQRFALYGDLTVEENLTFYGGAYGLPHDKLHERREKVIELLDLEAQRTLRTATLPSGWKQKLALGCALLHEPPVLFLDEPTGGVDPISRRRFWELIHNLADRGTTVFVTTHYMDEAEYCHRLSIMSAGRIIALDTPSALKERYDAATVEEVFVHLVDRPTGASQAGARVG
jgi:ABC-2 type transport system ATP-binding protein